MKCVVITGAAGGIGKALATRLAADGWHLHLCDINEDALNRMRETLPESTTISESQLNSLAECEAVIRDAPRKIDAFIHLAGIFEFHDPAGQDNEIHNRIIQHNQTNAYHMTVALQPKLADHGRIVFASSLAFNRGSPDTLAYSMAKGALVGLTRALSRRLANRGILVNAVAPGFIETPMLSTVKSGRDEQAMLDSVPLGRLGEATEVASVIAFLISKDASYITGQVINIDGGMING